MSNRLKFLGWKENRWGPKHADEVWIDDNAFGFAPQLPAEQYVPVTPLLPNSRGRPRRAL